ncbi:hypothetical protein CYMTET_46908, partial [Cymbomonas tetramitiformis]
KPKVEAPPEAAGAEEREEEEDESEDSGGGEYSYPSLVQTPDEAIHVAYTFRRETVRYARVTEKWIASGGTIGRHQPMSKKA